MAAARSGHRGQVRCSPATRMYFLLGSLPILPPSQDFTCPLTVCGIGRLREHLQQRGAAAAAAAAEARPVLRQPWWSLSDGNRVQWRPATSSAAAPANVAEDQPDREHAAAAQAAAASAGRPSAAPLSGEPEPQPASSTSAASSEGGDAFPRASTAQGSAGATAGDGAAPGSSGAHQEQQQQQQGTAGASSGPPAASTLPRPATNAQPVTWHVVQRRPLEHVCPTVWGCLGHSLGPRSWWQRWQNASPGGFSALQPVNLPTAGAGFDAGAAAEEAKRRAGQAKAAAAGWFGRARGVLTAVGREVTEVLLPKTGARRLWHCWGPPRFGASQCGQQTHGHSGNTIL